MPFTLYVRRTVNGEERTVRWRNQPDDNRARTGEIIRHFELGRFGMEGSLFIYQDQPVARWCDIKDIWIEEA